MEIEIWDKSMVYASGKVQHVSKFISSFVYYITAKEHIQSGEKQKIKREDNVIYDN